MTENSGRWGGRRTLRQMEDGAKEGERKVKEIGLQGKRQHSFKTTGINE